MTPYTTEIFFSDLEYVTRETLTHDLISRLREDTDIMADINADIIEQAEDDEERLTGIDIKNRTEDRLREKAEDILNRTFFAEASIGDETL